MHRTQFKCEWSNAKRIKTELKSHEIQYILGTKDSMVVFMFGDLPVRQFGRVWGMFKRYDQTKSDC